MSIASSIDAIAADESHITPVTIALIRTATREDALSLVHAAEEYAQRQEEFSFWAKTVRDPAENGDEGVRLLQSGNGRARAEYRIAALPDGQFAIQTDFSYPGYAGCGFPWSAFPTRDACIAVFLSRATAYFGDEPGGGASESHQQGRRELLPMLGETLFGFIEPPPLTEDQLPPCVDDESEEAEGEDEIE